MHRISRALVGTGSSRIDRSVVLLDNEVLPVSDLLDCAAVTVVDVLRIHIPAIWLPCCAAVVLGLSRIVIAKLRHVGGDETVEVVGIVVA